MTFIIPAPSDQEQNLETQVAELRSIRQQRLNFPVLDHGYVKYIDHLGDDQAIVEAARMSTQKGFLGWDPGPCPTCKGTGHPIRQIVTRAGDAVQDMMNCPTCDGKKIHPGDASMLEYMWVHHHASPFEQAEIVIEVKAPVEVYRQWHRHRTWMYSEMSARYSQMPNEHYIPAPERIQKQSKSNKQGSGEAFPLDDALMIAAEIGEEQQEIYGTYENMIKDGVSKEVARINTPVSRYSVMRAKVNLRNAFAFLALRRPNSAQWEIRQYADAFSVIINEFFPRCHTLFEEHTLYGVQFSRTEMLMLKTILKQVGVPSTTLTVQQAAVIEAIEKNLGQKKLKAFWEKLGEKL